VEIDALFPAGSLRDLSSRAREVEAFGFDGFFTAETRNDPFLPLALAAEHTSAVTLGTCVAVALPRSPMHLAQTAHALQQSSRGRLVLGLGSQIRPHIEKRYGAVWSDPVPRMREMVLAIRAIWRSWNEGVPLDFRGAFYRHTLMPPFFNPGPTGYGPPPIFLAGVGEAMIEAAGEVADGLFVHQFTTARYLQEVIVPALERAALRAGRPAGDVQIAVPLFVITGGGDEEMEAAERDVRRQIAFYGSTPAYRPVLALHGWGDLQGELNVLSKRNAWEEMTDLVPDDVVDAFAVRAEPEGLRGQLTARYSGDVERVMVSLRPAAVLAGQAEVAALGPPMGLPGFAV
jgi:probable F420-dependent oxidoreductase